MPVSGWIVLESVTVAIQISNLGRQSIERLLVAENGGGSI